MIEKKKRPSPWQHALQQLDEVAEKIDLEPWIHKKLRHPRRELIWYRKGINIEIPSNYIVPLRLTLKNTNTKAVIYFNNVLIGRYTDIGPQQDFYIYEDLIGKENIVSILVDGRNKGARLGEVSICSYYIAKKVNISFQLYRCTR